MSVKVELVKLRSNRSLKRVGTLLESDKIGLKLAKTSFALLPEYLQKKINQLQGKYEPNFEEARDNLRNDAEKNQRYLGTYFPRSFHETFTIFSILLRNEYFYRSLKSRKKLVILDIGSGNGGNLLGLMECLIEHGLHTDKQIRVFSVDGNKFALDSQKQLFEEFLSHHCITNNIILESQYFEFGSESEKFGQDVKDVASTILSSIKPIDHAAFDIVMTTKFINELLGQAPKTVSDLYYTFAETTSKFMESGGIILIADVPTKSQDDEWLPHKINEELRKFVIKERREARQCHRTPVDYILPIPCLRWAEICKDTKKCFPRMKFDGYFLSFWVLGERDFAERVTVCSKHHKEYFVNDKPFQKVVNGQDYNSYDVCDNGLIRRRDESIDKKIELNGFSLQ